MKIKLRLSFNVAGFLLCLILNPKDGGGFAPKRRILSKLNSVTAQLIVSAQVGRLFIYCRIYNRQFGRPGYHCWGTQTVGTSLLQSQVAAAHHPRHLPDHSIPGMFPKLQVVFPPF
jgi:hypothetical protein